MDLKNKMKARINTEITMMEDALAETGWTEKEREVWKKELALWQAIFAALEGPKVTEEEKKDLIDHFDWLRGLCNEDIYRCEFCKKIRAIILGHAQEEKK
jgi:hypothetical protein